MSQKISFGPAGLGPVKTAIETLENYAKQGIQACEIAFTYGAYIKNKDDAEKIGKKAKELGISLSIHGQYWINLNSSEKIKIEKSKERILECLKVGTWLQATHVVFHPGYYSKEKNNDGKEKTFQTIRENVLDLIAQAKKLQYTPNVAVETMGRVNVFGSFPEILKLVKETHCSFCIDFAHILAREKSVNYKEIFEKLKDFQELHVHFSGIEYNEKGEKRHLKTPEVELKKLLSALPKNKKITIINESPDMIKDTLKSIKIYKTMN